jgi:hypothetical protein
VWQITKIHKLVHISTTLLDAQCSLNTARIANQYQPHSLVIQCCPISPAHQQHTNVLCAWVRMALQHHQQLTPITQLAGLQSNKELGLPWANQES